MITQADLEEHARDLARSIARNLPPGVVFGLVLANAGEGGFTAFMSNANRRDFIALLRDLIQLLERS